MTFARFQTVNGVNLRITNRYVVNDRIHELILTLIPELLMDHPNTDKLFHSQIDRTGFISDIEYLIQSSIGDEGSQEISQLYCNIPHSNSLSIIANRKFTIVIQYKMAHSEITTEIECELSDKND